MGETETRNALVTGGSRGLGLAIALRLAREGWRTTVVGRSVDRLDRAREVALDAGVELRTMRVDVTGEAEVRALFDRLTATEPLHLCVNNAGRNLSRLLVRPGSRARGRPDGEHDGIVRHSLQDWEATLRLCLTSVFLTGREAAAAMIRHGVPGTIVNISSTVRRGAYGQSAYTAAKSGVEALTRTWAYELAQYGIRVVAVAPGVIDGEALRQKLAADPRHAAYMERLQRTVPLGRWAAEDEIAQAVCFAAENTYLTGATVEVDGGGLPGRVP